MFTSMEQIDVWKLAERVRLELGDKIEIMALHPHLCEEDGERFMANTLKDGPDCPRWSCDVAVRLPS